MADVIGTITGDSIGFSETIIGHAISPISETISFNESGLPNMFMISDEIVFLEDLWGRATGRQKTLYISDERFFNPQPITPTPIRDYQTTGTQSSS